MPFDPSQSVQVAIQFLLDPNNQLVIASAAASLAKVTAAAVAAGTAVSAVGRIAGGITQRAASLVGNAPLLNESRAFREASNFVAQSMNNVTNAAITLARTGFRVLVAEMVALTFSAKKVTEDFLSINEKFAGLNITLRSSFRSGEISTRITDAITKITTMSPIPFEGLAEFTRSLAILPQTRGKLLEQVNAGGDLTDQNGFLRQMFTLVEKMLAFRPDKNVADAIFSLREALGGEFRSLVRRFDIPLSLVAQLGGKTVHELKTDQPATLEALQRLFNNIIDDRAIRESLRQPSKALQNIREQIYDIPLKKIGDTGVYNQLLTALTRVGKWATSLYEAPRLADGTLGKSPIDELAPKIGASISTMLVKFEESFFNVTEKILSAAGFGKGTGGTITERGIKAVESSVKYISEKLPPFIERILDVTYKLGPLLAKLADMVLHFADTWAGWMTNNPISTILASLLGFQALKAAPRALFAAIGHLPDLGTPIGTAAIGALGGMRQPLGAMFAQGGVQGRNALGQFTAATAPGIFGASAAGTAVGVAAVGALSASAAAVGGIIGYEIGKALVAHWDEQQNKRNIENASTQLGISRVSDPAELKRLQGILTGRLGELDISSPFDKRMPSKAFGDTASLSGVNPYSRENVEAALRTVEYNLNAIKRTGSIIVQYTTEELAARKKATEDLTAFFQDPKNKLESNVGEALNDPRFFKNTFVKAEVANKSFETRLTDPSFVAVNAFRDELAQALNPLAASAKKLSGLRQVSEKMLNASTIMNSALTDASGIELNRAEIMKKTLDELNKVNNAIAADPTQLDTDAFKVGETLQEMSLRFSKLYSDLATETGGVSDALERARAALLAESFKNRQLTNEDQVLATVKFITEISKVVQDGFGLSDTARNEILATVAQFPDFNAVIRNSLNEMLNLIPQPGASAQEIDAAKKEVDDKKKEIIGQAQEFIKKSFDELMKQTLGPSGAFGSFTTPTPVRINPTRTIQTEINRRNRTTAPNFAFPDEANPNFTSADALLFDVAPPEPKVILKSAMDARNTGVDRLNNELEILKVGGEHKPIKPPKMPKDFTPDIQNAIQDIQSILGQVDQIRDGPLRSFLEEDFRKSIEQFPSLKPIAEANMASLFSEVKAGDQGLDQLYAKMKTVSDFSESFAKQLRQMAESADPASKDRYIDQAHKLEEFTAKSRQRMADMDRASNPFTSLFDGIQQGAGASMRALSDLSQMGQQISQTITQGLGNAFAGWVTGTKSAKEAFGEFAQSVIADLAKIAAEAAAKQLYGLLINLAGSAIGSLGGAASSSQALSGQASGLEWAFSQPAGSMASGGWVRGGSGSRDDVSALLMGGEYVVSKGAASRYGHVLEAMNEGRLKSFAQGGWVRDRGIANPVHGSEYASERSKTSDRPGITITINRHEAPNTERKLTPAEQAAMDREQGRRLKAMIGEFFDNESRQGGRLR